MRTASRIHDFSYGHRVYRHESKCAHLHGHNAMVVFTISGELDTVGRIIDFSEINRRLCQWLEENWDHRFLIWSEDPWAEKLFAIDKTVVLLSFNPTAENLAEYLVNVVGPNQLKNTGVELISVKFEETKKCSATYWMEETPGWKDE